MGIEDKGLEKNKILEYLSEDREFLGKIRNLILGECDNVKEDNEETTEKIICKDREKEILEIEQMQEAIENQKYKIEKLEEALEEKMGIIEFLKGKLLGKEAENNELGEKTRELETINDNKNIEIDEKKRKLGSLQDKLTQKEMSTKKLEEDLKDAQKNLTLAEGEVREYRGMFECMIKAHKKYMNLSDRTKMSLSGIFKDSSLMGFVACGVQGDNIESLWEYIKDELKEEKLDDMTDLTYIFEYLFNLYKLSNPRYEWQDVKEGENFDTDYFIRHSSGSVSGKVVEIIFRGYVNNKNGRIIKKTLVKVG